MIDLVWDEAQFHHRALLQGFECAELPLRRMKKILKSGSDDVGSWASRVQGLIRNLRPSYIAPKFLHISLADRNAYIRGLYYFEQISQVGDTLHIMLGLIGAARADQGSGLGRATLEQFQRQAGLLTRTRGCSNLLISAVVHERNEACRGMLTSMGWHEVGPAEGLQSCSEWAIRAERSHDTQTKSSELPLPIEIADADDAFSAFFPNGEPTLETPLGVAYLWWCAVSDIDSLQGVFAQTSYDPTVWGDLQDLKQHLDGWALMQNIVPSPVRPDVIAYAKLIPDPGHAARAFASAELENFKVITLVKDSDGQWRVWGLSENCFPDASYVLGE
ncbi:hypothetical protein ACSYDW_07175 [Paeniglutamicibacter sp. R2-26]|uniref:hypothetical protein n=1 Tax=Paeniglutamicibacter sp. R2-26 TaxID=3144417 RepID=UPI003EE761AB